MFLRGLVRGWRGHPGAVVGLAVATGCVVGLGAEKRSRMVAGGTSTSALAAARAMDNLDGGLVDGECIFWQSDIFRGSYDSVCFALDGFSLESSLTSF